MSSDEAESKPTGAQRCDLNSFLWQPSPVSKWCSLTERLFCEVPEKQRITKSPKPKRLLWRWEHQGGADLHLMCFVYTTDPGVLMDSLSSKNLSHQCQSSRQNPTLVHSDGSYHLGLPSIYWALSPWWVFWILANISRSSEGPVHINLVNKTKWV